MDYYYGSSTVVFVPLSLQIDWVNSQYTNPQQNSRDSRSWYSIVFPAATLSHS